MLLVCLEELLTRLMLEHLSAAAGNEEERTVTSTCIVLQTLGKFGIQTELSCLPLYQ